MPSQLHHVPVRIYYQQLSTTSQSAVNIFISRHSSTAAACRPAARRRRWSPILFVGFDPACQGQPVQFTDQSTGNVTGRTWIFPNGTPPGSLMTNPVVTWNVAGTFAVKLTVSGTGGPVSVTKQVVVKPLPVASFTYTVDGLAVQFTSTSANATTYLWDFGDGNTSDEQNPYHLYLEAGFYTVKLTASNECGSSTKQCSSTRFPRLISAARPRPVAHRLPYSLQTSRPSMLPLSCGRSPEEYRRSPISKIRSWCTRRRALTTCR